MGVHLYIVLISNEDLLSKLRRFPYEPDRPVWDQQREEFIDYVSDLGPIERYEAIPFDWLCVSISALAEATRILDAMTFERLNTEYGTFDNLVEHRMSESLASLATLLSPILLWGPGAIRNPVQVPGVSILSPFECATLSSVLGRIDFAALEPWYPSRDLDDDTLDTFSSLALLEEFCQWFNGALISAHSSERALCCYTF